MYRSFMVKSFYIENQYQLVHIYGLPGWIYVQAKYQDVPTDFSPYRSAPYLHVYT
jgi:hypothetical protein